jgi:hypothetical protein
LLRRHHQSQQSPHALDGVLLLNLHSLNQLRNSNVHMYVSSQR